MNSATRHTVLLFSLAVCGQAQTIQVDVTPSHMRKAFVPNQTLGAGIDRISQHPAVLRRTSNPCQPLEWATDASKISRSCSGVTPRHRFHAAAWPFWGQKDR